MVSQVYLSQESGGCTLSRVESQGGAQCTLSRVESFSSHAWAWEFIETALSQHAPLEHSLRECLPCQLMTRVLCPLVWEIMPP